MNFVKNIFQRLTLLILSISFVTLLMVSNAQAGPMKQTKVDQSIEPETGQFERQPKSADLRGRERSQVKLRNAENDDRASTNEPSPRGRDLSAYDEDASIGEKFSDTVGNAAKTFKEATEAVGEQNKS